MASYTHIAKQRTQAPQSVKVREDQVQNASGGYGFQVDCFTKLARFLVLGSCESKYVAGGYKNEGVSSNTNASAREALNECLAQDFRRTILMIVDFSTHNRAINNSACIFMLALSACHDDAKIRAFALQHLNSVCRIGTHIFEFVEICKHFRGWGKLFRRAINEWYLSKTPKSLAYQVTKYQSREGWSHRDVLRKAHPSTKDEDLNGVLQYVTQRKDWALNPPGTETTDYLQAVEEAKNCDIPRTIQLINDHGLVREHIQTSFLNDRRVWEALNQSMPMTAMMRNLNKMTQLGILSGTNQEVKDICARLRNSEELKGARIHPFSVLTTMNTYQSGRGFLGGLTWKPVQAITTALEDAFYLSFDAVEPTNQNFMLGVDISGSMTWSNIPNSNMSCRMAAFCMAMVAARTEPWCDAYAFNHAITPVPLTKSTQLSQMGRTFGEWQGGRTDCAQPMIYATENNLEVDNFIVYTDSETWVGAIHPFQALNRYQQHSGRAAKLIVCALRGSNFTIADPTSPHMLDVVGFDTAAPNAIRNFIVGS